MGGKGWEGGESDSGRNWRIGVVYMSLKYIEFLKEIAKNRIQKVFILSKHFVS